MIATPVIMVVAAEASGDLLGADLIRALKVRVPTARFIGVGGELMAAEGVVSPFDITDLAIFGVFEALSAYGRVRKRVQELAAIAQQEKPDIAILVDSWGFTVRVAKALKLASPSTKLVKYVGPQVWASRPGRAKVLAKTFDHLLAIVPFDAPFYAGLATPVTFVGNPSLAKEMEDADGARTRALIGAGPENPILLVLPGSRPGEIKRVMPAFEEAVALMKAERPDLHVVVPAASTVAETVKARVAGWPFRAHVVEGEAARRDAMKAATVALACSGTVTTEVAMAGCPMVVGYRMAPASFAIVRRIITTKYAVLLNIAADRAIIPEFIQKDLKPESLARAVAERLDDPALRARQVADQDTALMQMGRGGPDPSVKAADVIVGMLG